MGETKMWGVSGTMSLLVPYSYAPCGQWHSLSSHLAAGGDEHQWDILGRSCRSFAAGSKLLNILSFQVLFRCVCLWACSKQKSKLALYAKTVPSTVRHNCLSGFGDFGSNGVTGGEEGREAKRIQVTLCFQAAIRSYWSKSPYPCTEYTLTPWHIQVTIPPVPHPIPSHPMHAACVWPWRHDSKWRLAGILMFSAHHTLLGFILFMIPKLWFQYVEINSLLCTAVASCSAHKYWWASLHSSTAGETRSTKTRDEPFWNIQCFDAWLKTTRIHLEKCAELYCLQHNQAPP